MLTHCLENLAQEAHPPRARDLRYVTSHIFLAVFAQRFWHSLLALQMKPAPVPTLMDIVVATDSLSTLENALKIAGLLDVFDEVPLGVAVLAPDNDGELPSFCLSGVDLLVDSNTNVLSCCAAFDKLKETDPDFFVAVLSPPFILHLQTLLLTHVIDEVKSTDLVDGTIYETAAPGVISSNIAVVVADKACFIPALAEEGGCVTTADVMAKNGVAHVRTKWLVVVGRVSVLEGF